MSKMSTARVKTLKQKIKALENAIKIIAVKGLEHEWDNIACATCLGCDKYLDDDNKKETQIKKHAAKNWLDCECKGLKPWAFDEEKFLGEDFYESLKGAILNSTIVSLSDISKSIDKFLNDEADL